MMFRLNYTSVIILIFSSPLKSPLFQRCGQKGIDYNHCKGNFQQQKDTTYFVWCVKCIIDSVFLFLFLIVKQHATLLSQLEYESLAREWLRLWFKRVFKVIDKLVKRIGRNNSKGHFAITQYISLLNHEQ